MEAEYEQRWGLFLYLCLSGVLNGNFGKENAGTGLLSLVKWRLMVETMGTLSHTLLATSRTLVAERHC